MNKFRKKPVIIEAVQFTVGTFDEVVTFVGRNLDIVDDRVIIQTLEGPLIVRPNDWIIKGVNGEFYPCKPDIFEKTYEAVNG